MILFCRSWYNNTNFYNDGQRLYDSTVKPFQCYLLRHCSSLFCLYKF